LASQMTAEEAVEGLVVVALVELAHNFGQK
jgi:hypothetical protein